MFNPRFYELDDNGFSIVRNEFIMNSLNYGEEEAKRKIYKKYERMWFISEFKETIRLSW